MRLYRKLPADERRKDEDSEYIFEHHTERKQAGRVSSLDFGIGNAGRFFSRL